MMAEMIATYPTAGKGAAAAAPAPAGPRRLVRAHVGGSPRATARTIAEAQSKAQVVPAGNGSGYLNEVSSLTVHSKSGDNREA